MENIIIYIIWALGFVIGILAYRKAIRSSKPFFSKELAWIHILLGIFFAPVEIVLGLIELFHSPSG